MQADGGTLAEEPNQRVSPEPAPHLEGGIKSSDTADVVERASGSMTDASGLKSAENQTLLLHAEELLVSKQRGETGRIRVDVRTTIKEQVVQETLASEVLEIEHVPVGRMVDVAPETRQEDDVTIIPVLEEVLVVERRLLLKEEVRIRRVRTTEAHRWTVQVREQAATVTRSAADGVIDSAALTEINPKLQDQQ